MKLIIHTFLIFGFSLTAHADGYRICATWDTFCKSPKQIVATKCRLGVPVKHEECRQLGISYRYLVRGGGSLVDGLPVSKKKLVF